MSSELFIEGFDVFCRWSFGEETLQTLVLSPLYYAYASLEHTLRSSMSYGFIGRFQVGILVHNNLVYEEFNTPPSRVRNVT